MQKQAVIFHGWYEKISQHWFPWLKNQLQEKDYQVNLPQIPTFETDLPELKTALEFIIKSVPIANSTVIFGHSLGCLLAMRIAEKQPLKKMLLIAGWDFDDLTVEHSLFWFNKINHQAIRNNVREIYCISSDNDPYFTAIQSESMAKRLNAKFILIKGGGHFTELFRCTKIPEILPYI